MSDNSFDELRRQFENLATVDLRHEIYWSFDDEWNRLAMDRFMAAPFSIEHWHIALNSDPLKFGRFLGSPSDITQFKQLGLAAARCVTDLPRFAGVPFFRANLLHDGWTVWIGVLYTIAETSASPLLSAPENCMAEIDSETRIESYQFSRRLQQNVFRASAAAMSVLLSDAEIDVSGMEKSPIDSGKETLLYPNVIESGLAPETPIQLATDKESIAIALLFKHPEMSMTDIAERAGVSRQQLYRWDKFVDAAVRSNRMTPQQSRHDSSVHRGHKNKDGTVEAYQRDDDDV